MTDRQLAARLAEERAANEALRARLEDALRCIARLEDALRDAMAGPDYARHHHAARVAALIEVDE